MADHLPSLKRTPSKSAHDTLVEPSEPFFPLSLHVGTDEIAAMKVAGVKIGEERMLLARVRVTSISENEREGGEKFGHVELSLVEGTTSAVPEKKDQAEVLFGKDA